MRKTTQKASWSHLRHHLTVLDHTVLIGLIHDLYTASKDNQIFLHTRFALSDDVLAPYKATISRWVNPDMIRNQDISVSNARKAISDYKKAIGRPEGLADLSVFYCEACADLLDCCGMDEEGYFNALVRMFKQALMAIQKLNPSERADFLERLKHVQNEGHNWGWGVGDDMDDLMAEYGFVEE